MVKAIVQSIAALGDSSLAVVKVLELHLVHLGSLVAVV